MLTFATERSAQRATWLKGSTNLLFISEFCRAIMGIETMDVGELAQMMPKRFAGKTIKKFFKHCISSLGRVRRPLRRCVPPSPFYFFSPKAWTSALWFSVFSSCRIRYIYLLCFALMAFLFPGQLGAMDDSDEDLQLINDVAHLDSQLKQAGCPCDENLYVHLFRDLDKKPLAKRLNLWRFRKTCAKN
jgi:hypothetical protein